VLHYPPRDLTKVFDASRIFYGQGRGEFGICLHMPLKGHLAGAAPAEDHLLMVAVANHMIDFLRYRREVRGPEAWDYDPEKASELYEVCGDNPNGSGVILHDTNYASGPKIQIFLDKTFGANEISVRWKNQMVGDEHLIDEYMGYVKREWANGGNSPEA